MLRSNILCNIIVNFYILLQIFFHNISMTCIQAIGSILKSQNICLQKVCSFASLLIHINLFCSLKMLLLIYPWIQKIKPYLRWAWQGAKLMHIMACGSITSLKDFDAPYGMWNH